jgi:drug/metabolite transporter (DMT)-like permease
MGFVLAVVALFGIASNSVVEKYLIVSKLNPVLLAASSMLVASGILWLLVFIFKYFNIGLFGDLGFKNTFGEMSCNINFLVAFFVICTICATTKLCIFTSLKFISPFQLNIVLAMMPIIVLVLSSMMHFDAINVKTVASLILFMLAISIQIFL